MAWAVFFLWCGVLTSPAAGPPPAIKLVPDGRSFVTQDGRPYVPLGINYYRPGTGWAPQVWKQFDPDATRKDFALMKSHGVNCVRVFLTFGSFCMEKGRLSEAGLAKFDQFLRLAEDAGLYVHPTGPDHWEGTPPWAANDRIASEEILSGLEDFWRLFAKRYAGRSIIFAYDLRNEPEVPWDTPAMKEKWARWVNQKHGDPARAAAAWSLPAGQFKDGLAIPENKDNPGSQFLLDYQRFREDIADDWTRRQVAAIKSADPKAMVTVGLIQWSVPAVLPSVKHYAAFRPSRQARFLDFMEFHFYPLARGAYEYRSPEDEDRNLAYLECLAREVALAGKPVVIAEFGWYGGAQPKFDGGRHPLATEEQQARWCRRLIETTAGLATGWLNWGFFDQPEARDVSELTGLLTADGKTKAWGREFQQLSARFTGRRLEAPKLPARPEMNWDLLITSPAAGAKFSEAYYQSWKGRN